jgi:3-oxoacyl-[acyl-carrier protein] reductase
MDLQLGGKGVLVTGAGGFLGSAIAAAFAAEGAAVAVHHRDERDRATAEKLAAAIDGVVLRADLSLEDEADALVPDAARALGRLDICVANAGRFPQ